LNVDISRSDHRIARRDVSIATRVHHGLRRVDLISSSRVEIARRSVDSPSESLDAASESLGTATRAFDFA
jgi:hypothetical protein